jgi:hypothetical protein
MYSILLPIASILLSYGDGEALRAVECKQISCETSFDTNVHVNGSVFFPRLEETGLLTCYANYEIEKEARERHDAFVQEMSAPQESLWEEDGDEFVLAGGLLPVYFDQDVICFYGCWYRYSGGAHGSWQYETRTFGRKDDSIKEISFDDLFAPVSREWLFKFCRRHFIENKVGYYADDDRSWIPFNQDSLDAFVLTEKGLLLIFQNYTVGGLYDEPITLLIPFKELTHMIKADTPIAQICRKSNGIVD